MKTLVLISFTAALLGCSNSNYTAIPIDGGTLLLDAKTGQVWTRKCIERVPSVGCVYSAFLKDDVEGLTKTKLQILETGHELSREYWPKEDVPNKADPFSDYKPKGE